MTRKEQREATTRKLSAVAKAAFQHNAYDEVTFRNLAKAAGVSTGAYFSVWPSKAHLYADVMGRSPPDAPEFLARVAIALAGTEHAALGLEAEDLRRRMIGHDQHS